MPEYRRARIEGGTFFFTVISYRRLPILTQPACRAMLRFAWLDVQQRFPFKTLAVCLLPEHLHSIWELPEGDADFSLRWKEIKRLFTKAYLAEIGAGEARSASREKQGEAAIWQRRFWEHAIRDEQDFYRHLDYVHYNPVKHGLVQRVADWQWSSFHRYARQGWYEVGWGDGMDLNMQVVGE